MKTVFQSIPDCIHVYFQFNQTQGRCGNVFFDGDTLYSYGRHFELVKLVNGVLWINTRFFSNSTARHQSYVRQSINLEKVRNVFYLDFGSNRNGGSVFEPEKIAGYHLRNLNYYKFATKARGFKDLERVEYHFNQLQILANGAGYVLDQSNFELNIYEALQVLEQRREAQRLTNQKREATCEAKRARARELQKASEAERLGAWLKGEANFNFYALDKVYLRIKANTIETTKGARVPLSEGIKLLAKIRAGVDVTGEKIGSYQVTRVTIEHVVIGCHVIDFETINELFQ